MDLTFVEGAAATVSAIVVFVGSAFLLMTMVMGARLAYFVTATVTLSFLLMMGVVWSLSPLGPVGDLADWDGVGIGATAQETGFGPASAYPENPWRPADEEDEGETTQVGELSSAAGSVLEDAISEGEVETFTEASDGAINDDRTRLLEQDGDLFGAVTFEPVEGSEATGEVVAVLEFDPGNPLGPARTMTVGVAALFVLHLWGLSRQERRVRRKAEANARGGA
ncbi:MAG: hypothetical protein ACRDKB_10010 [Actinomycetota bacterium]